MAPLVRRTWAPRGYTPVLRQRARAHTKVSVIAALSITPARDRCALYFGLHPNANITDDAVVEFVKALTEELPDPLLLIWDRSTPHRATVVTDFLKEIPRVQRHFFPPYAPELNPVEYVWTHTKMNAMANRASLALEELTTAAGDAMEQVQGEQDLLRSFLKHSGLPLRLR
ncbi:MAG: transposase [Alphaproteobacteria bacterium]|uniref:Transposase n=1 Tax=Candidatus Nitrobium versatile TaxID=2884831 RepID=A0A953J597_9BACT|nr:transposase [Candidatus Nitrobium versatile]